MSWVSLITLGLQLVLSLLQSANNRRLIDAGRDREIAAAALRILDNTQAGKRIREHVRKLDDEEANALWKDMTSV